MDEADRWAPLDEHLPAGLRRHLEDRLWRPIEAQATLEVLRDDPAFFADPGRHPAMFADHGVVHVRDVAAGLIRLVDGVNGVLLARRPADRLRFVQACGVATAYLHDIGMVDMSRVGRRTHALYAAHAAFGPDVTPLVEHLLAPGPVRTRLDEVAADVPFRVPLEIVVRELLSLSAAHSKSTVPAALLDDRAALRRLMRRIVFTGMDEHRAAAHTPVADDPSAIPARGVAAAYDDPGEAFAWLDAVDGRQASLADDVVDALRALRAADVLRQRGTVLRTSGGYEICFDARTAQAVCTLRSADGEAAYVVTYDDHRGAGEANIRVAFVTPGGDLRFAFHRGGFADEDAEQRAAISVAGAIEDIQADVIPSFSGLPARGLPPPTRDVRDVRIQLERPDDHPGFATQVALELASLDSSLGTRIETVSNVEDASAAERRRYYAAHPIDADGELAATVITRLADHGAGVAATDPTELFAEVAVTTVRRGTVLVAAGSSPSFVYVPTGPGLVVRPDGGYTPSPLHPWVPVGTTGVIRRAGRNSEVVADKDVEVVMIPAERYVSAWLRPLSPDELRDLLQRAVPTP